MQKKIFFLNQICIKVSLTTYMCYEKIAIIFDINTFKLF